MTRLLKAGDCEAAGKAMAACIGTRSVDALSLEEAAMAARVEHRRRRWAESAPFWHEVIRRDPANSEALFRGGQAYLELGRLEEAAVLLARAERSGASLIDTLLMQARAFEEMKQTSRALDIWVRLVDLNRADGAVSKAIALADAENRSSQVISLAQKAIDTGETLAGVEGAIVRALVSRTCVSTRSLQWPEVQTSLDDEARRLVEAADDHSTGYPVDVPLSGQGRLDEARQIVSTAARVREWTLVAVQDRLVQAIDAYLNGELSTAQLGELLASVFSEGQSLHAIYAAGRLARSAQTPGLLDALRKSGYVDVAQTLGSLLIERRNGHGYAPYHILALRSVNRHRDAAAVQLRLASAADDPWALSVAAIDSLLAAGDVQMAVEVILGLEQGAKVIPARQRHRMILQARCSAALRRHDEAAETLRRVLLEDIEQAVAWVRLSASAIALSDYSGALDTIRLAGTLGLQDVNFALNSATAFRALGDMPAAGGVYLDALKRVEGVDDRLLPIVADYVRQVGDETVLDAFLADADRRPSPDNLIYRTTLLYEFGALDAAEAALQAAPVMVADSNRLAAVLCRVLVAQNRFDEAVTLMKRYARRTLSPEASRAFLSALVYAGEFHEAETLVAQQPAAFGSEFGRLQALHNRVELELNGHPEGPWWTAYRDFVFVRAVESHGLNGRYVPGSVLLDRPRENRLLLCTVQGVGDEIRNASLYPDVLARFADVTITCDPRLESLLTRSFPEARFLPCRRRDHGGVTPDTAAAAVGLPDREFDRIMDVETFNRIDQFDAVTTMSDALAAFRPSAAAFVRRSSYLKVDPARRLQAEARVRATGTRLKVGFTWRSVQQRPMRNLYYSRLQDWGPIFALPDAAFFNFLHGEVEAELADAEARFGVEIDRLADVDLKDDFEGVAALLSVMDVVIAPCVSVAELAGAVGTPTLMMWRTVAGRWRVAPDGRDLWHETMTPVFGDRPPEMESLAEATAALAETYRPRRANQSTAAS